MRLDGLTEVHSLFAIIPDQAKTDLKGRLERIGQAALALQEAAVPRITGGLASTLTMNEQVAFLRVKVGLTKIKKGGKNDKGNWYGIFVEYGRHAGAKIVERRRRVDGKLRLSRGRRKRAEDIASTYVMHIKAKAGQPFVHQENRLVAVIDSIMSGFWETFVNS